MEVIPGRGDSRARVGDDGERLRKRKCERRIVAAGDPTETPKRVRASSTNASSAPVAAPMAGVAIA